MDILFYTYIFILGLLLGSFYNVVGLRIPLKQSIVTPRSHCTVCKHTLTPIELIPVLSYILQLGKCKKCETKFSPLYPVMELLTGILFLKSALILGWTPELIVAFAFISLLVIITVSDLAYMIIPDKILLFFLPLFILLRIAVPAESWWDPIAGALTGFSLLLLIAILTKGNGMGFGDVKLYFVIGIVLGVQNVLLSFFLASLLGSIIGGMGLLLRIVQRKKPIPFGPFIATGAIISYFFGDTIVEWYLNWITFM